MNTSKYDIANSIKKPKWLKASIGAGKKFNQLKTDLKSKNLATVCEEAKCPNLGECWQERTATIMILGDTCTRACRFCNVKTGNPNGFLDPNEISNAAKTVTLMDLEYVVLTSVDRDDLKDQGANHFAQTISKIKEVSPKTNIEVLIPDFNAVEWKMKILADSKPFVIAQNIETVKRLTSTVRDRRASYEKTLKALSYYKQNDSKVYTKSSIMLGLGETHEEIIETIEDLARIEVDILTFGQYLRPSLSHLKVQKYYSPEEFKHYQNIAYKFGIKFVASGPMVRSSYKAGDFMKYLKIEK